MTSEEMLTLLEEYVDWANSKIFDLSLTPSQAKLFYDRPMEELNEAVSSIRNQLVIPFQERFNEVISSLRPALNDLSTDDFIAMTTAITAAYSSTYEFFEKKTAELVREAFRNNNQSQINSNPSFNSYIAEA